MSRPTKLTPEVQQRLCDALATCNYYRAACAHAGIGYNTFRAWMKKGKAQKRGQFREFWRAVQDACARAELAIVALWRAECPGNYQACRDLLDRRYPQRWGKHERVDLRHQGKVELQHAFDLEDRIGADPEASRLACQLLQRLTTAGTGDARGSRSSGESAALDQSRPPDATE